jgi:hypothetical protein
VDEKSGEAGKQYPKYKPNATATQNKLRIIRISAGVISLGLGVIGMVLPILQGWFFLALGVVLLSKDIVFFRRITEWMRTRFPFLDRSLHKAKDRLERFKDRFR